MAQPLIALSQRRALAFAGFLVLYQILVYIANDMIMPGMIHVVASFHGDPSDIATSLTAYVLGGASLQIFLGPLSDRFGRRPVMLVGASLFLLFTTLIVFSTSMSLFLLARYFEGMGLCFIGVVGYATLQEIYAEMDAVRLIAILSNVSLAAPLLGPLAGATFILHFDWRGIFVMIAAVALVALLGLWLYMPESIGALKRDGERIPRVAFTPAAVLGNYRHLLTNRAFMMSALSIGILNVPCIAWIALSPSIIVTQAHLSVVDYALWQLPLFGASIFGNVYLRYLTHRYDLKTILLIGSFLAVSGLLVCALLPMLINEQFVWLLPGLVLYGFGMGVATAPFSRLTLFSTPVGKGTAYAMISMVSMSVQAFGVECGNYVYRQHSNAAFGLFCGLGGLLYLAGLAAVWQAQHRQQPLDEEGNRNVLA